MKVTYFTTPITRAGERIPIQDIQDGEKFRVVSQQGMYVANTFADTTQDKYRCRFKRRGDALYKLYERGNTWKWRSCNGKFFEDRAPYSPWMIMCKNIAKVIVEIY